VNDPRSSQAFSLRRRLAVAAAVAVPVSLAYVAARDTPLPRALETATLDWRFRLRGPVAPGGETALLMIDDATLAALGRWPVPRKALATAVDRLAADRASVIAFDLLLAEAEPVSAGGDTGSGGLSEGDRALAVAIRAAGRVVVPFAFVFTGQGDSGAPVADAVAKASYPLVYLAEGHPSPPTAGAVVAPLPILAAGATTAHVSVLLDIDGSLRFDSPVIRFRDDFYPSLPVEAVRLHLGLPRQALAVGIAGDDEGIRLSELTLPTDPNMLLPVNHYGPDRTFATFSLIDLLDGRLPGGLFTGRIVVIGASATGVGDRFDTPYSSTLPGAEHHATVIDNILHRRSLRTNGWMPTVDLLAVFAGATAAAAAVGLRRLAVAVLVIAGLIAGWAAITAFAFAKDLWLNVLFPSVAIALTGGSLLLARSLAEYRWRREAERQRANLSRCVPRAVAASLAAQDLPFANDREQNAAVMFLDMVGFTRLGEGMSPPEQLALLRDFHWRVQRIIDDHGGTIDKFVGDGASASFGIPEPSSDDAARALRCSLALAHEFAARGSEPIGEGASLRPKISIGLHYGPVVIGEIGGERQQQFTVSGDTVNVASRLEALTRLHGATIIASDALIRSAHSGTPGVDALLAGFVPLASQPIRGRTEPVDLWLWPGPDVSA
jgi:adenylate cyclase